MFCSLRLLRRHSGTPRRTNTLIHKSMKFLNQEDKPAQHSTYCSRLDYCAICLPELVYIKLEEGTFVGKSALEESCRSTMCKDISACSEHNLGVAAL